MILSLSIWLKSTHRIFSFGAFLLKVLSNMFFFVIYCFTSSEVSWAFWGHMQPPHLSPTLELDLEWGDTLSEYHSPTILYPLCQHPLFILATHYGNCRTISFLYRSPGFIFTLLFSLQAFIDKYFWMSSMTKAGTMPGTRNTKVSSAPVKLRWTCCIFYSFIHSTNIHSVSIMYPHCSTF